MLIVNLNKHEKKGEVVIIGSVHECLADFGYIASSYLESLEEHDIPHELAVHLLTVALKAGIAGRDLVKRGEEE